MSEITEPKPSAEMKAVPHTLLKDWISVYCISTDSLVWANENLPRFGDVIIHEHYMDGQIDLITNPLYKRDEIVEYINQTAESWKVKELDTA